MKLLSLIILSLICSLSALAKTQNLASIKAMIEERKISTMEEFIAALPQDLLTNFTLMHTSKSLHGSTFENPRAILFGKTGQWVVSFNGHKDQAAGSMIEMMLYDPAKRTYAFHEINFSGTKPVIHEAPTKCLACHGSNPRPIWDQYNAWPGAYGDVDDRFSSSEYAYLTAFMEKAPAHPRYQHLKKLKEGYTLARPGFPNDRSERSMVNRNRDMNIVLYQQKLKDLAYEMSQHPDFSKVKGLIYYFLSKCYLPVNSTYQGDGYQMNDADQYVQSMINKLKLNQRPDSPHPLQPEQILDFIFSRLQVDTNSWYFNSRDHATYKSLRDGTDRLHESLLNYLLEHTPEYRQHFYVKPMDYQVRLVDLAYLHDKVKSCAEFTSSAMNGIQTLGQPLPQVNSPEQTMRGERVCRGTFPRECRTIYRALPQMCLKCHTQKPGDFSKIYLPFHEFPERSSRQDLVLIQKMKDYVTSGRMPMRTSGDAVEYSRFQKNDLPKLKKYLDELIQGAGRP